MTAPETTLLLAQSLERRSVLAVELHSHSAGSYDGRDSVERLLEHASRNGLDAIAITDHDVIEESLRATEHCEEYGIVAIPGIEVTTTAGHVLALGVEELVPKGLSFAETVDVIHDRGGLAVVPHPYQTFRRGVLANVTEDEVTRADALEVLNSRFLTGRTNRQARALALEREMPQTAGSDAHVAEMVGKATTLVDADERSVDAILNGIRDGWTEIDGQRTPYRITLRQIGGTVNRHTKNQFGGLFR